MMNTRIFDQNLSYKDIFYAFLLLCLSGNPFFPEVFTEWVYLGFAAVLFLMHRSKLTIDSLRLSAFKKWTMGFIALFVAQFIFISPVSIPADINFLAKFFIAFTIPCILGAKFRYAYLRAMTITAAVSLLFFTIFYLTGWHTGMQIGRNTSILIYNQVEGNLDYDGTIRNSGMFWEPGAFQGYINLVPLMFINELRQLWKQERLSCIILLLALITTFSTTGYMVLMFIIGSAFIKETRNVVLRGIVGTGVVAGVIYAITSFDFLGEKMQGQFENAATIQQGEVSWSRFGAAVVDYYEIARSPITGNGFMMDARYPKLGDLMAGSGNGFTGAVNAFGIIVIFFYVFQLFKRASGTDTSDKAIYAIAIVLMLQGEFFLNYPMFWALLFISYPMDDRRYAK